MEARREQHREYIKKKYHNDPEYRERHKATVERRKKEMREWFYSLKRGMKCEVCGESHIACIDLHHVEKSKKEFVLGNCWNKGWSKETILAEVAKCRPLCANCHRKEHWDEEAQCFTFDH